MVDFDFFPLNMRRGLVILDLNGTLLDRPKSIRKKSEAYDCIIPGILHAFSVRKRKIYLRPHLDTFLRRLHRNFDIAFWTSAKRENAQGIVDKILLPSSSTVKPVFSWFREQWYFCHLC